MTASEHVVRSLGVRARLWLILGLVVVATVARAQPAAAPYARDLRVAYLGRALSAVHALGADGRHQLERVLYLGARARCRAALARPSITCMLELAAATCVAHPDPAACALAADVILTNTRAELELVDEATRMSLVAGAADYHTALLAEVETRHGRLAAELIVAEAVALTRATTPARIDRFCAHRGSGRVSAPRLDWQRCAAGLVWFIGSRPEPP